MSHSEPSPKYWRSLGELADTPEFRAQLEAEFPVEDNGAGFSRRRMLQLMGASLVLASAGSCRWKEREVLPFNKRPENRTPGKFERYATAMELGGTVLGLLVTCVDGRPIKVEGNPKHPNSMGATNAYAQAAILELYDPDRSRHIIEKTPQGDVVRSWEDFGAFAKKHFEEYKKNGGEGLAFLVGHTCSPTEISLRKDVKERFPKSRWCMHEAIRPQAIVDYDLAGARIIVCLDADLFGTHPQAIKLARQFAETRETRDGKMARLYVIESRYTITGAMADHRLPMLSSEIEKLPALIGQAVSGEVTDAKLENNLSPAARAFFAALVADLNKYRANSVIAIGPEFGPLVQDEVALLNIGLKSEPNTSKADLIEKRKDYPARRWAEVLDDDLSDALSITELTKRLDDGSVSTLAVIGGDPVLDVPADIDFLSAMKKVTTRIHLALYVNETSQSSSWHIPQSHFLESWGDVLLEGDRYTVQQPLIEPLHGGKSAIEFLTLLAEPTVSLPAEIVRSTFENLNGDMRKGNADTLWRETLHEGIKRCSGSFLARIRSGFTTNPLPRRSLAPELPSSLESNEVTYPQLPPIENGKLEITFRPSPAVYDGRFANLSWLQEMPDPITRITWDNVALISPATAEKLGVKHEEVVRLKFKGREIEIPAYILPGQADGSVAVTLGYGRTAAGKVGGSEKDGVAPVGVNTYKLRTSDAMWFGTGLTVEPTGKMHPLASVAEHFAINSDRVGEDGRKERLGELVREATVAEYQTNPTFAKPSPPAPLPEGERSDASLPKGERKGGGLSLWQEHKYEGHCWGMTVDLSKCVGCGACVVACMAENNVPVVGKERIFRNREMHWLRVDRYFRGDPANPQIVFQPMFCQHCEMAPCEGVCPVGATVHSTEGLNEMVYNRCVGTRYCANNCPYKVRRFNFFNYHKQYEDPDNEVLKMASNPQVTVRMRGVMEKCTYCVQRIETVKIEAKNEKRTIKDGEIRTACQQVCPAGAIVFGDLNDETSEVYRLWKENRSYQVLGELYTKPRTWYLARIRNPNPELEKAEQKEGIQHGGTEGREKKES